MLRPQVLRYWQLWLAGLLDHLDQNLSGFGGIADLAEECDAGAAHPLVRFRADMKAEAVDGSHGGLLRLDAGEDARQEHERIFVIDVHVLDDSRGSVGQGIGLSVDVIRSRDPAHDAEAADVVNVDSVHPVEREIVKVDPVLAVLVAVEIELARVGAFGLRHWQNLSY